MLRDLDPEALVNLKKEIDMKFTLIRSLINRWYSGFLVLAVAASGFFSPATSYAVTSGSGVWDFMIFGNYDLVSPDTGNVFKSSTMNSYLSSLGKPVSWAGTMQNGYGAGIGTAYWFNDVLAFRLEVQGNFFQMQKTSLSPGAAESAPITGGLELKLYGNADYYLYGAVDAGVAYELSLPNNSSPTLSGKGSTNAWSSYGDVGIGVNLDYVFIEAKFAYLPNFIPEVPSATNALWYIPVTVGFNF